MKDFIQDITPPDDERRVPVGSDSEPDASDEGEQGPPERSIRNISVTSRARPSSRPVPQVHNPRGLAPEAVRTRGSSRGGMWLWALAVLMVVLVVGLGAYALLGSTTIDVVPRTQPVVFDPAMQFTATPAGNAATGTLAYTTRTTTIEDSTTVQGTGVEHVEERASGTITVYNAYSSEPVKLIKNTRFETPDGHIYRTPSSVVIPGKSGSTPGSVEVTVFADQSGEEYNVGPVSRLTVPGLKDSSPDMYESVYAAAPAAFTGGFSGERPAVSETVLDNARSQLRSRLETKARDTVAAGSEEEFVFPELMKITYQSLPSTTESGGSLRVNESATIQVPVFDRAAFTDAVARYVSADASESDMTLIPEEDLRAVPTGALVAEIGSAPIVFSLSGKATLVWNVDRDAVAAALAGREQDAFMTIIGEFSGIETAHASIAPFWSSTFPEASDITVSIADPNDTQ